LLFDRGGEKSTFFRMGGKGPKKVLLSLNGRQHRNFGQRRSNDKTLFFGESKNLKNHLSYRKGFHLKSNWGGDIDTCLISFT